MKPISIPPRALFVAIMLIVMFLAVVLGSRWQEAEYEREIQDRVCLVADCD